MGFQELGHSQAVVEVQLHPDVQSLEPPVAEETVKGGGDSSQGCGNGNRIPQNSTGALVFCIQQSQTHPHLQHF